MRRLKGCWLNSQMQPPRVSIPPRASHLGVPIPQGYGNKKIVANGTFSLGVLVVD